MIFPWTMSLGKIVEEILEWTFQSWTIGGKPLLSWFGISLQQLYLKLIPPQYYHFWVCDTEGLMLYTLIVFVVGAWLGYVLHYPKKPAGEGAK